MSGAEDLKKGFNSIVEAFTWGAVAFTAIDIGWDTSWDTAKSFFGFESATAHAAAVGDSIPQNA